MATAKDVAKYILELDKRHDGEGISNLKLQKLAYYSQGFFSAIHNRPLFPEKIEAWTHGPVVPELYHEYKHHGNSLISVDETNAQYDLSKEETDLIDEVYDVFGQFSAWKLRNMTHEETPWRNHEEDSGEISIEEMRAYFKTRIE